MWSGKGKERLPFELAKEWGHGANREAQSQGFKPAPFALENSGLQD